MTSAAWPSDWLIPDWPAPSCVRSVCTTRAGGASQPPYDGLNLGDHVGDDPHHVAANRDFLCRALGPDVTPVFLQQVHGPGVLYLCETSQNDRVGNTANRANRADAAWSDRCGVACTVLVADCLPLLLTTRSGRWVAAIHVGWRGLAGRDGGDDGDDGGGGILERTCQTIQTAMRIDPARFAADAIAWLGPCIGPAAFEVGPDVHTALTHHHLQAAEMFCPESTGDNVTGKWRADLAGLVRQRLFALGIHHVFGNDSTPAWCTVSQPGRFYSHRRDRPGGRFAASIWLQPGTF